MKISVFYDHIREAAEQSGKSMDEVFQKAASFGIKGIEIEDNVPLSKEDQSAMFIDFLPELPLTTHHP
mgnify:CR=1 FL=1